MPALIDRSIDLSAIATLWDSPVTTGLETISFFGATLAQSLRNLTPSGSASPLLVAGSPVVSTPSGIALTQAANLTTGFTRDNSETFMFVVSSVYGTGAASVKILDNLKVSSNDSVGVVMASSGFAGPTFEVGFVSSAGAGLTQQATLQAGGANSAQTIAATALPNFYVCKIDMANMVISYKSMSPAAITAGWGTGTGAVTTAITAGNTQPVNTVPYRLGGYQNTAGSAEMHFFAKFNRATTLAEDAAMYAAVQNTMGLRGVTI